MKLRVTQIGREGGERKGERWRKRKGENLPSAATPAQVTETIRLGRAKARGQGLLGLLQGDKDPSIWYILHFFQAESRKLNCK